MELGPSQIQELIDRIEADCRANQMDLTGRISVMMLYGSRFRDTYRENSDLDLICFSTGLSGSAPVVYYGKCDIGNLSIPMEYRIFDQDAWTEQLQYYPHYFWRVIGEAQLLLDEGPGEKIQAMAQDEYEKLLQNWAGSFYQENLARQIMQLRYFYQEAFSDIVDNFKKGHRTACYARLVQIVPWFYTETLKVQAIKKIQADEGQVTSEALSLIAQWDLSQSLQSHHFRALSIHRYPFDEWYQSLSQKLEQVLASPNENDLIQYLESLSHVFHEQTGETLQALAEWWMVGYS